MKILYWLAASLICGGCVIPNMESELAAATMRAEESEMASTVTAEVILRAPDGASLLDAQGPITAQNVARYHASEETIQNTVNALTDMGFTVLQIGPSSITIGGNKALFEEIFLTTLALDEATSSDPMQPEGAVIVRALDPLTVPEELTEDVAAIVFPEPPVLFP